MIVTLAGGEDGYRALYEAGAEGYWRSRPATMADACRAAIEACPDRIAVRYFDRSWTYAELDDQAGRVAAWLRTRGVAHGERVALLLQNVPEFIVVTLAAWRLGAVPVPVNPAYRGDELGRILVDAQPRVVICDRRDAGDIQAVLATMDNGPALVWTDHGRDTDEGGVPSEATGFATLLEGASEKAATVMVSAQDIALLMYTSGTTGKPKGAMLSHGNLIASARIAGGWMKPGPASLVLVLAPMFHITGFVAQWCLAVDGKAAVLLPWRMQAEIVIPLIRAWRPTHTIGAISAFSALMNFPGISRDDFTCFERVGSGGAPIAPALRERIADRLGLSIYPGFGMTETSAVTHYCPVGQPVPVDPASGALAIGIPAPGSDAMIADEKGEPLPAGEPGELLMRGPQIMQGYRDMPEETSAALAGGWMHSGDIAVRDDAGWFYIVDRKKDVIIASGFKIWPREVEDCLYRHPAVREAAVVAAPDEYRGETVKAVLSVRSGMSVDEAGIVAHCREHLAGYKIPRIVEFRDELPKTVTGKIQRNVLRQEAKS